MRKVFLSLLVVASMYGATNSSDKATIENNTAGIQVLANNIATLNQENEYQHNINIEQEKFNNNQIDINNIQRQTNESAKIEYDQLRNEVSKLKYSAASSGSDRYILDDISRLKDKIDRLERQDRNLEDKIRQIESKMRK